jgi:hypothetical protein
MIESSIKKLTPDFPCILQYYLCGEHIIVFFKSSGKGMVLASNSPNAINAVGNIRSDFNMDTFHKFNGEIVLRNVI